MDLGNVQPGYRMGPPTAAAVVSINKLVAEGHKIIVFTGRNVQDPRVYKAVADWLDYFKIPVHGITNVKSPDFDVMVDNRALHYQSWPQVLTDLSKVEDHFGTWSNHADQHQGMIKDITQPLDADNMIS